MLPEARALRGRGADEEGLLARPDRPRRCTLPMTALRVIPPNSAAIWLADRPSAHNFFRSSTRSSVQPIVFPQPFKALVGIHPRSLGAVFPRRNVSTPGMNQDSVPART